MKNGKYVLNYQHACYDASGCASPICLALTEFSSGKKREALSGATTQKNFLIKQDQNIRGALGICTHPAVLVEGTLIQTGAREIVSFFNPIVQRLAS